MINSTLFAFAGAFWLALAPTPAVGAAQGPGAPVEDARTATATPLARVAFIGASVTAGYGNAAEMQTGGNVPLGTFFAATLQDPAESEISDFGSGFFFQAPHARGERQVSRALAQEPTLVIGVDFLFWYAFGYSSAGEPRRAKGLAGGLAELERFECPLIIGDLPSIEHAMAGKGPFGGPIVQRGQFPSEEERAAMNVEIKAWADARDHVQLIPLSKLMDSMVHGKTIRIGDEVWEEPVLSEALQKDLLHPQVKGSIWTALLVADTAARLERVDRSSFRWSASKIKGALDQRTHERRVKYQARVERSAERKRKLEERRKARTGTGAGKGKDSQ